MLAAGLVVGGHPWNLSVTTINSGLIDQNYMDGANILAVIDGVSAGTIINNNGANRQGVFPIPNCLNVPYTAGDYGATVLQAGHVFQTYHNLACQY